MGEPSEEARLAGRVVVVDVDAPRGPGMARRLARSGADVVVTSVDAATAGAAVEALARDAPGAKVAAFVGDPDDDAEADALVELVAEVFARRD